jgi:hypothetical protein
MELPFSRMTTTPRLGRIIGLLALAALLAGCSAIKLGYNNLAEVAYWWLDGYVDFTEDQAMRVREDLARLHLWHRVQELPRLERVLHGMEELTPGDVSPAQACAVYEQVRERLNAFADQAEPAVITLAMGLAPDQLVHLERKYRRNNSEFEKKWLRPTAAEVADKRFEQFLERSETIYGHLDPAQRAVLRSQVEKSIFDPKRELAERRRRQQDALQTVRQLAGRPVSFGEARDLLRGYLARAQEPPDAAARSYRQAFIDEACRNFSGLHNSTNAVQRQSAARRLRAYERDLHELAAQK